MSTSNRTIGKISPARARLRFFLILAAGLLAVYLLLAAGLSWFYVSVQLWSGCSSAAPAPRGFEEVSVALPDGTPLKGWWSPPRGGGAAVLLLGGQGAGRDAMLPEAELLARAGFGALTLDYRTCAGQPGSLGYYEIEELQVMADFALTQPGVERLGVLGFSVGGTTAIRGAARRPELLAVLAEGNNPNLGADMLYTPSAPFSLEWLIQRFVFASYALQTGVSPERVDPLGDLTRLASRAVLLVHGDREAVRNRALDQQRAAGPRAGLWIVPDCGHGGYRQAAGPEYDRRVLKFFKDALFYENRSTP